MKKNLTTCLTSFSALIFATSVAFSSPSYLCIADHATGFFFKNGEWQPATFIVDHKKYIVSVKKPVARDLPRQYVVTRWGDDISNMLCGEDSPTDYGIIVCEGGTSFRLDLNSMRYMSWYPIGYTDGENTNDNTPWIEIGTCSSFK